MNADEPSDQGPPRPLGATSSSGTPPRIHGLRVALVTGMQSGCPIQRRMRRRVQPGNTEVCDLGGRGEPGDAMASTTPSLTIAACNRSIAMGHRPSDRAPREMTMAKRRHVSRAGPSRYGTGKQRDAGAGMACFRYGPIAGHMHLHRSLAAPADRSLKSTALPSRPNAFDEE